MPKPKNPRGQWFRVDLHMHTPASLDYKDKDSHILDILRRAEYRGVDILAVTDHNTVAGFAHMREEIQRLVFLDETNRTTPDEARLLNEYRRLLNKILVLPGFEFSATFGFHILGIFPQETPVRSLEHVLMSLNVPSDVMDRGDPAAGSTADVLDAYRLISEAGGLAIAAHINSTHGVMMRGLNFGGQTRIAYTQDKYLAALELTDMASKAKGSTRRFFDGTKAEYPRRMHVLQGSDAHSLDTFVEGKNVRFGVGERATEMLLHDASFAALKELFESSDFNRTRPYSVEKAAVDFVQAAREEGANLVQSFHETFDVTTLPNIVADVCAFANTNGGTLYIGISGERNRLPIGVARPTEAIALLNAEISRAISPQMDVDIDTQDSMGKAIIRVMIPYGEERPYAINDNRIYVRDDDGDTSLAMRDEIVTLVRQGLLFEQADTVAALPLLGVVTPASAMVGDVDGVLPPRAGVEIAEVEQRSDVQYFTMRDLRNGSLVKNVTLGSARRLWHYAIKQYTGNPVKPQAIDWHGAAGLIRRYEKGGDVRYDLAHRDGEQVRIYYGVTESGMDGVWAALIPEEGEPV